MSFGDWIAVAFFVGSAAGFCIIGWMEAGRARERAALRKLPPPKPRIFAVATGDSCWAWYISGELQFLLQPPFPTWQQAFDFVKEHGSR